MNSGFRRKDAKQKIQVQVSIASIDLSVNQANGIFRLIRQMGQTMVRKVQGALSTYNRAPWKRPASTGEKIELDFKLGHKVGQFFREFRQFIG